MIPIPQQKFIWSDHIPKNKKQKYKVSDEKVGEHFDNLGECKISLNRTQKTLNLNEKIDNFYFLKINNYCYQKKWSRKQIGKSQTKRNSQYMYLIRTHIQRIYFLKTSNNPT